MLSTFRPFVILVLTVSAVLSVVAFASTGLEQNDKVKRLLHERLATVTKLHDMSREMYIGGQATIDDELNAQASLLAAKLALAETKQEKQKVYAEQVSVATESLQLAKEKVEGGVESKLVELKAQAHLLEIQIAMERSSAE